jgi:hypothetical protein
MKEALAWIGYGALGLTMIGAVASYMWDDDYVWWPLLFAAIGCALLVPLILLPMFLAVFKTDSGPEQTE